MYQILAYNVTAGVNDVDVDMTALPDPNFSRRGGATGFNHWIFTEKYSLMAAYYGAVSALRARLSISSWNSYGAQQIYPPNRSLNIPSNPQVRDLRSYAPEIPMNEELAVLESNNLAAATEQTFAILFIAPHGEPRQLTRGVNRIMARFTAAVTTVANGWTGDVGITITDQIKGGTYAVNGLEVVGADVLAARLNLVHAPTYQGRKLQAGCLATPTIGNVPLRFGPDWLGEMGRFNNFELPQIAFLSTAAAAITVTGFMDLTYLGDGMQIY